MRARCDDIAHRSLGHVIGVRSRRELCRSHRHGFVHVAQFERYGPLYVPDPQFPPGHFSLKRDAAAHFASPNVQFRTRAAVAGRRTRESMRLSPHCGDVTRCAHIGINVASELRDPKTLTTRKSVAVQNKRESPADRTQAVRKSWNQTERRRRAINGNRLCHAFAGQFAFESPQPIIRAVGSIGINDLRRSAQNG